MKKLSIRMKITLWFGAVLAVMVGLTYIVVLSISDSMMQKQLQDNLVTTVEDNVDEVEYYSTFPTDKADNGTDLYLRHGSGYMEIDDDFLDKVNGIYTALYQKDGTLVYGENPIAAEQTAMSFSDDRMQTKTVNGVVWYLFDRKLTTKGLEGFWLRGTVSSEQGNLQLSSVVRLSLILMPLLMLLAVCGGYLIAGRFLSPIKQITQTAAQIGQGRDLKQRIALKGGSKDELHQLALTFDEMFERLDASFEAERQFTSDASHELRTPMAVIMAECEYMLEQERSSVEYEDALRVVYRQGKKMSRLIEDMLMFTRMERRADVFSMKELNFSQLAEDVCEDMRHIAQKNISLSARIEPKIWIFGNYDLLVRLLTNLITNAYRYGKENGHITVALSGSAEEATLSVKDDGMGISREELEKIFLRFYQSDAARSGSGTGLGLAMVREIAQFHRGRVFAESTPGEGSTFFFQVKKQSHESIKKNEKNEIY